MVNRPHAPDDKFTITYRDHGTEWHIDAIVDAVRSGEPEPEPEWAFPVGEQGYPVERWYVASFHDPTGVKNGGYKHTGVDINLAMYEFGDVERRLGLGVFALTRGLVTFVTEDWYGAPMIVIRHRHEGEPLFVRYAHIIPAVKIGDVVNAGNTLGAFADWRTGDHLHLDMSRTPYTVEWFTDGMLDPIPILKAHLDPARVNAMVAK